MGKNKKKYAHPAIPFESAPRGILRQRRIVFCAAAARYSVPLRQAILRWFHGVLCLVRQSILCHASNVFFDGSAKYPAALPQGILRRSLKFLCFGAMKYHALAPQCILHRGGADDHAAVTQNTLQRQRRIPCGCGAEYLAVPRKVRHDARA